VDEFVVTLQVGVSAEGLATVDAGQRLQMDCFDFHIMEGRKAGGSKGW